MRIALFTSFLGLYIVSGYSQIPSLDIYKAIINPQKRDLSYISETISYIPLSNSNQTALISDITLLSSNNSLTIIYDYYVNKIFLFDARGKYLKTIMNYGKGPNEFLSVLSVDINLDNEILFLLNGNKICILDAAGSTIKSITLASSASMVKWIARDIIAVIYGFPNYILNDGFEITFLDRSGKRLAKALPNSNQKISYNGFPPRLICGWNNDTVYYWNEYRDTVYSLTKSLQAIPRFCILNDKHQYSIDLLKKGAKMNDAFNTNTQYIIGGYNELGGFAFISGVFQQKRFCIIADRKTGLGSNIFTYYVDDHFVGLLNDLDGGFDFWPGHISKDGSAIMSLDPNDLRQTFVKHQKTQIKIKQPAQRDSTQKNIIDKITLMDNPILIRIEK
jgi:hypothetical protein